MSDHKEKKKRLLEVINDKHYKPLKQKELAFLLQIPQEDRAPVGYQMLYGMGKSGQSGRTHRVFIPSV